MSSTERFIITAGVLLANAAASALELVDPMQPPPAPPVPVVVEDSTVKPAAWRLGAIKIEPGRRSAMINGHIVAEGEQVDGARVVAIAPRAVEIAVGNETVSLSLLKHDIKHRPSDAR